jgi:hypothetical protein
MREHRLSRLCDTDRKSLMLTLFQHESKTDTNCRNRANKYMVSAALACGLVAAEFLLGHAPVRAHYDSVTPTPTTTGHASSQVVSGLTASPTKKKSTTKTSHAKKSDHSADHEKHADAKSGHNSSGTKLAKTDTKPAHDDLKTGGSDDPLEGL